MYFASKFVLAKSEDEYESLDEEEFEQGMHVSNSDSSGSDNEYEALPVPRSAASEEARGKSPKKKKKLHSARYHWRRKQGGPGGKPDAPAERASPGTAGASSQKVARRRFRRADTNVVSVNFDTLLSPGNMYAGDPVPCPRCRAILSHISTTEGQEDKVWQCEFCSERVPVDLEPEEIPGTEDVTYLLSPAPSTASASMAGLDQSLVIFCVDTSGSMCVTSEISGKVKLRGTNQLRRLESFNEGHENQFLPSQRNREVTYVSRLQAMQAAVDHQLAQMSQHHPDRRVALVAFNNEVTIMGDGSQQEVVVAGDKLAKLDKLREVTQDLTLPGAIKTTRQALGDKVYSLEEGGATALGPALVVAVNMAASHPGSKVILCTDGKANVGLGKLEVDGVGDEEKTEEEALEFYNMAAQEAANKGVTVSVITIQGTDCKLVHLGTMADKTGGQVNIVDCMKLTEEFGNILADPIIATKVKATFLLHKELFVVDETDPDKRESRAEQTVGNVKSSSNITFEFAKRKSSKEGSEIKQSDQLTEEAGTEQQKPKPASGEPGTRAEAEGGVTATAPTTTAPAQEAGREFPFQLQIEYMDAEGNKALRVITRRLPATTDRSVTEEAVNLEVLGAHAAKKSADLALQGQYSRSRGVALMNQRLAWRQAHSENAPRQQKTAYKNIFGKIKSMENHVQQRQMMEISEYGRTRSDSEGEEEEEMEIYRSADMGAYQEPASHFLPAPYQQAGPAEAASRSLAAGSMVPNPLRMFKRSKEHIASKNKKMHNQRSSEMDDSMANVIYKFRSVGADEISSSRSMFRGRRADVSEEGAEAEATKEKSPSKKSPSKK